ncbi:MAG: DUF3108 domain-containing protein [Planctomycetota bacterium]
METKADSRILRRLAWLAVAALVFALVYKAERRPEQESLLAPGPHPLVLPSAGSNLTAVNPFRAVPYQREPELLRARSGGSSSNHGLDIFFGIDPDRLSGRVSDLPLRRRIPFDEHLDYAVQWNGMNVGTVNLWTQKVEKDDTKTRINCQVRSNSVISAVYEVKDDLFSVIESKTGAPCLYSKKQDEGGREREEYLSVDPLSRTALYRRFKNGRLSREVTYDAPRGVVDPLGVVYVVRSLDPDYVGPIPMQILGAKRVARTTARFLPDTEEVSTPLGRFTCKRLVPDLKDEELLEDESRRGEAIVWMEVNTGVLIKAELKMGLPVGSVSLIITSWQKGLLD